MEPTRAKPCPGDVTPSALLILSPPPKAWNGVHGRPGDVVARLSSRCAPNKGEAAGCMAPVRSASRGWCQAHCTWLLLRCSSAPRRKGCRTWSASAPQNANVAGSTRGCPSPARCAGNCDAGHRAAAGARVLPGLGTAAPSCPLQGEGSKTRNHRDGGEATGAGEAMRGQSHVGCELYRTLRGKRWSLAPRHAARRRRRGGGGGCGNMEGCIIMDIVMLGNKCWRAERRPSARCGVRSTGQGQSQRRLLCHCSRAQHCATHPARQRRQAWAPSGTSLRRTL